MKANTSKNAPTKLSLLQMGIPVAGGTVILPPAFPALGRPVRWFRLPAAGTALTAVAVSTAESSFRFGTRFVDVQCSAIDVPPI